MQQVVFMSVSADLMVPFVEPLGKDLRGYATPGKAAIIFKDNKCTLTKGVDDDKIQRLREAAGNMAHRGNSYWEVPQETFHEITIADGGSTVTEPDGGVTKTDVETFAYLDKLPGAIPPKQIPKVFETATTIYERYTVRGVPKPNKDDKPKELRSKIVLMLDTIKKQGVWNNDQAGQTDIGGGQEEHK